MAPRYIAASQVNTYSGRLRAVASTRSPLPTPELGQGARRAADSLARLRVGERLVLVEQPWLVRDLGRGRVEELGDRQRHRG